MTKLDTPVKNAAGGLAALKNVARFMTLVETLRGRSAHLPGIGVFNGPSGYGKSYSAIYAQNLTGALRVEVGDSWTRKKFLQSIVREAGHEPGRATIADLTEQAILVLGDDWDRPLIIDEADKLADKGMLELVREIQEHSQVPMLLIGEELLPAKLQQVERVHNRVLEWVPAEPCDIDDTHALADLFCPELTLSDSLLERLLERSGGRARRIVVNLNKLKEHARNRQLSKLSAEAFADDWFYTGEPPRRLSRRVA
ncbi:AAA family ATPase [Polymorphum gilvum]|uniref:Transposase protein B n=1 Tax=Polymorphum gilvum (strain LMG 25793 / CGMCC 1.9160 / SL003B-26A1) TaxID=991905 RepID=F2J548_POLGS|nr:ATP-binding protein [Polymorphum gilvum]ADZ70090.1 Transposase protein B [Polymorphum gilvum SL003B-26A1]